MGNLHMSGLGCWRKNHVLLKIFSRSEQKSSSTGTQSQFKTSEITEVTIAFILSPGADIAPVDQEWARSLPTGSVCGGGGRKSE